MNCDQAFDVMTSNRRESDRGLHTHLASCPRCRVMRETLDPALELFERESCAFREPEPWEVVPDANEIATRAARRLSTLEASQRPSGTSLWGYASAIVLGAGLVWFSMTRHPESSVTPSIHRGRTICQYMTDSRPKGISAQKMTQSCLACHAVTDP